MKKIAFGVVIVMLGIFLLFNNLEFFRPEVYHYVVSWQTLLIAIGAILLFDRQDDHKNTGVILVFVGALFLIPRIFDVSTRGFFIPLLLIAAGIGLVIRAATRKKDTSSDKSIFNRSRKGNFSEMPFEQTNVGSTGVIKREYVFTGSKEKWTYGKLKDVEIEAVFSGVELDFTQVELSPEVDRVHVSVSSVFSGVVLYVPEDWNIIIQKTGVFGGFADKRPASVVRSAAGKLVIFELEAVFGGGEIRCYE